MSRTRLIAAILCGVLAGALGWYLPPARGMQVINPSVTTIQGVSICSTSPTTGQLLQYGGTQWCGASGTYTAFSPSTFNYSLPQGAVYDLSTPPGFAPGDVLYAEFLTFSNVTNTPDTISAAGWTQILTINAAITNAISLQVFRHVANGSEGLGVSFSMSSTDLVQSGAMVAVRGEDLATFEDVTHVTDGGTNSYNNINPGVTTTKAGEVIVIFMAGQNASNSAAMTAPSGSTELAHGDVSQTDTAVNGAFTQTQATAGATGSYNSGGWSFGANRLSAVIATTARQAI